MIITLQKISRLRLLLMALFLFLFNLSILFLLHIHTLYSIIYLTLSMHLSRRLPTVLTSVSSFSNTLHHLHISFILFMHPYHFIAFSFITSFTSLRAPTSSLIFFHFSFFQFSLLKSLL